MTKLKTIIAGVAGVLALSHASFAANVTVADGSILPGIGSGNEDQENEPAASFAQMWDLEALVVNGPTLSIVGGFPMLTHNSGFSAFKLGDIFIDTDGNFVAPPFSRDVPIQSDGFLRNSGFNFEYVVRFNRTAGPSASQVITGFDVIELTSDSRLMPILYADGLYPTLDDSNPYQYKDENGATVKIVGSGSIAAGTLAYTPNLTDGQISTMFGGDVNVTGGSHNVLTLTFTGFNPLDLTTDLHLTMGCGNDNILGRLAGDGQNAPDGGATLALLGLGLASLTLARRKTVKA